MKVRPTLQSLREIQEQREQEQADEWFNKLPRKVRRQLERAYGISKGARRKGGGLR